MDRLSEYYPGFKAVRDMGFKNAKLLYLKNTFMIDWVNKGYPATHYFNFLFKI